MKKILLLFTILLCSLAILTSSTKVLADESDFEYSEKFGLSYEDYKKDGSYIGDQKLYLNSSGLTAITFDLEEQINSLTYPAFFEIDELYLEVKFTSVKISDNLEIYSPDSTMEKLDYVFDPAITTTYEADYFYHYFSLSDISNIKEYTTTFYYESDNSAALSPYIFHTTLNVHYVMESDALDDIVDVGTDYSLLPDTNGEFIDIFSLEEYDHTTLSYKFMFIYNDQFYSFNLAIPKEIYEYAYISPYEDDPVYFSDFEPGQMSYSMNGEDNRVLYIQPVLQRRNHPVISETDGSELVVGFVTINLTTMEYEVINKLELNGIINKEANRFASLYCFFPAEIDELLSITVSYDYRINSVLGIKGDWQSATNTYIHGESYEGETPNWIWWIPAVGWGYGLGDTLWGTIYDVEDVVMPIREDDIPDEVVYKYVNELDGSIKDLENLELYKVSLGQFQDGLFTAATDENAYDISDFVILEILYSFDGKVYLATSELIDSNVLTPELSGGLFSGLFDNSNGENLLIWAAIAIIGIFVFTKLKLDKKPGLLIIIVGAIVYILYKLGYIPW